MRYMTGGKSLTNTTDVSRGGHARWSSMNKVTNRIHNYVGNDRENRNICERLKEQKNIKVGGKVVIKSLRR